MIKKNFLVIIMFQLIFEGCAIDNKPEKCNCAKNIIKMGTNLFDSLLQYRCDKYFSKDLFTEINIEKSDELKKCLEDDDFYKELKAKKRIEIEKEKEREIRRKLRECEDQSSFDFGYSVAQDQLGKGLIADCDYLYDMAVTVRNNINYRCFCKGVNFWMREHQ